MDSFNSKVRTSPKVRKKRRGSSRHYLLFFLTLVFLAGAGFGVYTLLSRLPWLNLPWLETKQLSKLRARVIHVKKRPTCSCPGGLVQLHCFRTGPGRNVLAWSLPQPCMQPVDCHAWFIRLKHEVCIPIHGRFNLA